MKNLRFSYDGVKMILDNIDFTIAKGEMVGIVGDSGCGKSTLCHILCGIIPGAIGGEISGHAVVGDIDLREAQLKDMAETVGFVMQDPDRQIVTSMVEDELAFGPENFAYRRRDPPESGQRTGYAGYRRYTIQRPKQAFGGAETAGDHRIGAYAAA